MSPPTLGARAATAASSRRARRTPAAGGGSALLVLQEIGFVQLSAQTALHRRDPQEAGAPFEQVRVRDALAARDDRRLAPGLAVVVGERQRQLLALPARLSLGGVRSVAAHAGRLTIKP